MIRTRNVEKVASVLSADASFRDNFLEALEVGQHGVTAVAWLRSDSKSDLIEPHTIRPAWLPPWIDVASPSSRPGRLPQHDAGEFYALDLSSTFALAPLSVVPGPVDTIVDVCAAPGGKGILAWRYAQPRVVVANEVIRKRTAQLISNYKRCAIDPSIVTSCDPELLARLLEGQGDLVIVDAPCSGQSLVLKDKAAPGAFHPATIAMNERRQRRILAQSGKVVRPGGFLLYATCTFSPEENESNVEWFCETFGDFRACEVPILHEYRSQLSELPTYRLFPQQGYGAGAFCCLLQREGGNAAPESLSLSELPTVIRPVWSSTSIAPHVKAQSHTGSNHAKKSHSKKGERYGRRKGNYDG